MTESTILRIVARINKDGYIRRTDAPELADGYIQAEVRDRLEKVGLDLLVSNYSDAYGACLSNEAAHALGPDWLANNTFTRNLAALTVVLWAKLILPRRVAMDNDDPTGQLPLPGMELVVQDAQEGKMPTMSRDQIHADFGKRFGDKSTIERYLSRLRKLGIVEYQTQREIRAGPMLDIVLPGPQMKSYVERELAKIVVPDPDFDPKNLPALKGGEK